MPIQVIPLDRDRYLVVDGARQRLAFAVRHGDVTWVFIDGEVHAIAAPPAPGSRRRADSEPLAAPMPATVTRVDAAPGQQVARGDVLLVLEAMKMELPLKAPRDGVVKAVLCRPGELVQPGVPLVELE
jgi:3-methylcrotonyl-CoA carboxylase alpha subunit